MKQSWLTLLIAGFLTMASLATPVAANQTAVATPSDAQMLQDRLAATQTAEKILDLAVGFNFHAMYDMIHPDAKSVVPRAAAVGAFDAAYRDATVSDTQIVGVELGPWKWGVTGEEYPYAAKFSFIQSFANDDGTTGLLEDDMYLVKSDEEWRWFFGSTSESVQAAIDMYGTQTALTLTTDTSERLDTDLIVNTVNDLDTFWAVVLAYTDSPYESPGVFIVEAGDRVQTACGPASTGFWGFYCPVDGTMYIEEQLLDQLAGQGKSFTGAFVIAHEWAHHIQTLVGMESTVRPVQWNEMHSIDLELMADCLSGVWARDVQTRGAIDETDVQKAMEFSLNTLGDPSYITEYAEQAHGNGEQRVSAFMGGYESGFLACNILI